MMSRGPLAPKIADTFRSGTYSEMVNQEPILLYRVYGENASELGAYWTKTPPVGLVQSIVDSAPNTKWGNSATNIVKIEIPAGTKYFEGIAAKQEGLVGGGNQVVFPDGFRVDSSWVIK